MKDGKEDYSSIPYREMTEEQRKKYVEDSKMRVERQRMSGKIRTVSFTLNAETYFEFKELDDLCKELGITETRIGLFKLMMQSLKTGIEKGLDVENLSKDK